MSLIPVRFSFVLAGLLLAALLSPRCAAEDDLPKPDISTAAGSVVNFNEIMFHPPGDNPALEWIELYNQMAVDIELSNWRLDGGVQYRFPTNVILPANGYVVIAADPSSLAGSTGSAAVYGPFTNRLSNAGERIRLRNHNNRIMDELTYRDEQPWPVAADGSGASLAKIEKYSASSPAANWRASAQVGGTPGRVNFPESESGAPQVDALISIGSASKWIAVTNGALGQSWTAVNFDDSTWNSGKAAAGFSTNAPAGVAPVARAYSFEDSVLDMSGQGFSGDNRGADFTTNSPAEIGGGKSIRFDGVSDQVQIADPFNPTSYTISAWVLVNQVRPSSLLVRTDGSGPTVSWSHQLRINATGRFEHYIFDGGGKAVAATNVIETGMWYHLVATATNGGYMYLYVNGKSSGTPRIIGNLWSSGNQWILGSNSGSAANFFSGMLDEIGIWHTVLSTNEISSLAAGLRPSSLSGYSAIINTDVKAALWQKQTSLYLRLAFQQAPNVIYDQLNLLARYDDGVVAYLNGTEIARRNVPPAAGWDATALTNRTEGQAVIPERFDLMSFASLLLPGKNVLALHGLNSSVDDPDFLLNAELSAQRARPVAAQTGLMFNETGPANAGFFIELVNHSPSNAPLGGCVILSSQGGSFTLGQRTLAPGEMFSISLQELGFPIEDGDKLFLIGSGQTVLDGLELDDRGQGRSARFSGRPWLFTSMATPGSTNAFALQDAIVINEIMYHAPGVYPTNSSSNPMRNDEQWIELYNRSSNAVSLAGWRLAGGARFSFPSNSVLLPGRYLVLSHNAAALRAKYSDIEIIGNLQGRLSHRGDQVLLLDAGGNPADEVNYYETDPWPAYADGGGSTLELKDVRMDNSLPEAWAPSDESAKSRWRRYTYRAAAVTPPFSPPTSFFRELRLGLLDDGEALVDNITVVEFLTNGAPRQLLQNTNFTAGADKWRIMGTHSRSRVEPDPDNPENRVMRVVARGPMSYMDNRLESSFRVDGAYVTVVAGREYEISYDARWLAGSPQLHTDIYYNKLTVTKILEIPGELGTPGKRNSRAIENAGPTISRLRHSPVMPPANQPITIHARATDPDNVASLTLWYSVNSGAWRNVSMSSGGTEADSYQGIIPGQAVNAVVQFYLTALDQKGGASTYPAEGTNSRALIRISAPQLFAGKQTFRIIMTTPDATQLHRTVSLMSDDLLGCTVVHNEKEVFYNSGIRLHGSMFSRTSTSGTGMTVKFPADHLFRGSRKSIVVRRSGMTEAFLKHLMNQVGGLAANYDDVVYLISHRSDNVGPARMNLAPYDDTFVDSQFENNNDGTIFKLEGIRIYQQTDNGTPEGFKLPQPVDFSWTYDFTDLGNDPEQYRWSIMISNQRRRDDYSRIVNMCKSMKLTGTAFQQAIQDAIDVDQWARYFAIQNIVGIGDIYGVDNPHNICFYVRPDDQKLIVLQNDWGFPFNLSSSASIYGRNFIYSKLFVTPAFRRLYQGHILNMLNTVCNRAYVTRWAQHYAAVTTEGTISSGISYIDQRNIAIRRQLMAPIAFDISSNGGNPLQVDTPVVQLEGLGWIDVREIRRLGDRTPLRLTWLDDRRWQATVPLRKGVNDIQLAAFNHEGIPVGADSISVTTTSDGYTQRDHLRITEFMYNPPSASAAEIQVGFVDRSSFEFIELMNTGPAPLMLSGLRFTAGITFDFTNSTREALAPGETVVLVADRAAFQFRYGTNLPVAGEYTGQLDNAGELIRVVDAFGGVVQEFTYDDEAPWEIKADGDGYSLELVSATTADFNDPAQWKASAAVGGAPGLSLAPRPVFLSVENTGSAIEFTFQAQAGQVYTVHGSDDLTTRQWRALKTFPAGPATRIETLADPIGPEPRQRYYRISIP